MTRGDQPKDVVDTFVFQAMIIDYLMKAEIGQAEFARRIGITPAALSLWLSDRTRRPDALYLFRAAYEMGIHPWFVMKAVGLPVEGPPPSNYRRRTLDILDREPRAEHVIHRLDLLDPAFQESVLSALEALVAVRRNGQESQPSPE